MARTLAIRPSGGPRTWTVIDGSYQTVGPVEEWLEAHRYLWSPNTVRGYATALTQWWTFLEQRGETEQWNEVGVPAISAFLSWLRNGRTVELALVAPAESPAPETLAARLAAVISFYRWQEAVFGVPVARRCAAGYSIYFTTLDDLVRQLTLAEATGRCARKLQTYLKPAVLVLDLCRYRDYAEEAGAGLSVA
jgi:IstB-like ATP binding protein/Phage integrase, N-terminal SAM-like domain